MNQPQKTRRPPSPASRKGAQQPTRLRLPLVAILIVVVAVVLVGAAFVTTLGDDDNDQPSSGGAVAQVQAVTASGDPLTPFPGNGADDPSIGAACSGSSRLSSPSMCRISSCAGVTTARRFPTRSM